jgi:hypothetical protein
MCGCHWFVHVLLGLVFGCTSFVARLPKQRECVRVLQCSAQMLMFLRAFAKLPQATGNYIIQGGSNMTGTNCDLFTHKSSRTYLNHLVSVFTHGTTRAPTGRIVVTCCLITFRKSLERIQALLKPDK